MSGTVDWRPLYPFASHEITLGGHRYHYLDEGTGEPLVLVHGNPTWSFYWRELVAGLRGHYRVLVPDHIGCGLSDKPDDRSYSYRLAQRVADLGQWIEQLDLRQITLVGHDWGGGIGMGAAVTAPERFARFVLMNTAAFRDQRCPTAIRLCRVPLLGRLMIQGLNVFARAALALRGRAPRADDPGGPRRAAGALRLLAESRGHRPFRPGHPLESAASQLCDAGADRGRAGPVPRPARCA